jgi:hypothetical protein
MNNTDTHIAPPFLEVEFSYSILNIRLSYIVVNLFSDDNSWYHWQSTHNGFGPHFDRRQQEYHITLFTTAKKNAIQYSLSA